jgi:hypothetical protein
MTERKPVVSAKQDKLVSCVEYIDGCKIPIMVDGQAIELKKLLRKFMDGHMDHNTILQLDGPIGED